jgi:glycosyltransferase involved in cell wall biosynthesis
MGQAMDTESESGALTMRVVPTQDGPEGDLEQKVSIRVSVPVGSEFEQPPSGSLAFAIQHYSTGERLLHDLKALFVAPNLNVGGAERQWSELIPRLPAHGVYPTLLTLDGKGPFFHSLESQGVPTYCAGWESRLDARKLKQLWADSDIEADVVVARGLSAQLTAYRLSRMLGVPYVVTEHTQYELLPPRGYRPWLLKWLTRRAPVVVAVSASQRSGLIRYGYDSSRIRIIPNGVASVIPIRPDEVRRLREKFGIRDGTIVVSLVAALRPEKRIGDFVEIIRRVRDLGHDVEGLVAGGGGELESLRELAYASGGGVRLLGEVKNVDDLWGIADIACLTSQHEVLSMTLLEAMAHGIPLVATDVGGSSDLCVESLNGYLAPVADIERMVSSISMLSTDFALRTTMGDESRNRQRRLYDVDIMAREYAKTLRSVVKQ